MQESSITTVAWAICVALSITALGCDNEPTAGEPDIAGDVLDVTDLDGGQEDLEDTNLDVDLDVGLDVLPDVVADASPDILPDVTSDLTDDASDLADEEPVPACERGPVPVIVPPGLFWDGDIAALRSRIETAPFDAIWANLQTRARGPIPDSLTAPQLYVRGNIAKAAALVGIVDEDTEMLERARDMIAELPQTMEGVLLRGTDDDIHIGDGLVGHSVALHLLRSTELDTSDAEDALVGLADAFFEYFSFFHFWWGYLPNNHTTKAAAGLGLVALAVPDAEQAPTWLGYASAQLAYLYQNWLYGAEGGYAEGPNYNTYASITTTPFVIALHRALAGESGMCGLAICQFRRYDFGCQEGPEWAPDLLTMPVFQANLDWTTTFVRPDGTLPPYDDSNPSRYPAGPIAGPAGHAGMAWMFLRWSFTGSTANLGVETLLGWDDALEPVAPTELEAWLPEAGTAMRRTGWEPDDRYVFFLAEPSAMQAAGHEQADSLSLTVFDRGAARLIDCGYSQYTDHEAVWAAEQHNTVFIDGVGTPVPDLLATDNPPAYLISRTDDTWVAETTLPGGDVTRTVRFVADGTIEVTDHVTFAESGQHTLSARWHSVGGLTPEEDDRGLFEPTNHGGSWTSGGVVTLVDALGATASHDLQHDGLRYATLRQHRSVIVEVVGETEATLVTRIWVGGADENPPW